MKPLLVYLQPRDIPEILEPMKQIPCDQLHIKYFDEMAAQEKGWDLFKNRFTKYTHYFGNSNDGLVTADDFHRLKKRVEENPDKLIISGVLDLELNGELLSVCIDPPDLTKGINGYNFIKHGMLSGLHKVTFSGGALMMAREVFDRVDLQAAPCANDYFIYRKLLKNGIEAWADFDIHLFHLRGYGQHLVGIKEPEVLFIRNEDLEYEVCRL